MHIRCPHCRQAVDVLMEAPLTDMECPSCGSNFELVRPDETVSFRGNVKQIDQFQLLEHVGNGKFGDVWKALDSELDRIVAVKVPRSDSLTEPDIELFFREARAAAQVRHPHIVSIHEMGRLDDHVYIVSDFIDGANLKQYLTGRSLSFQEIAELVATVADALHAAHEAGVVHRDMKPQNILVDKAGIPSVSDFGLAKREQGEITVTVDGQILGTPAYMPPEQASGHAHEADRRADVYSLGVVLYELLTGRMPFRGDRRMILYEIQHDEPEQPRKLRTGIPRDLQTICLKAMAKERSARYQTAADFRDDLKRYLAGEAILARPLSPLGKAWKTIKRKPAITAVAVLVMACAALAIYSLWSTAEGDRLEEEMAVYRTTAFFTSDPTGTRIVLYPLHPSTWEPQVQRRIEAKERTPFQMDLEPGDYLVVAVSDHNDRAFMEVIRRIPAKDEIEVHGLYAHERWDVQDDGIAVPTIRLPKQSVVNDMASFDQSTFTMGIADSFEVPAHTRQLPAFYLDCQEVDVALYRSQDRTLPSGMTKAGSVPDDSDAIVHVSFDEAIAFAERMGKRLPSEAEFEFAATLGGQQSTPFEIDDDTEWVLSRAADQDVANGPGSRPIRGLFSGPAEWTGSGVTLYPAQKQLGITVRAAWAQERIVRGGSQSIVVGTPDIDEWREQGARGRLLKPRNTWAPGLGFRCARTSKPRLTADDFESIVGE